MALSDKTPTVFVVDDDGHVRESLFELFRSIGLRCEVFGSVDAYGKADHLGRPGCLVLDVRLPGQSGLDFCEELGRRGRRLRPIIFISGHADVPMSVRAMKAGAFEFLTKPVREQDLLDAVQSAIEADCNLRRVAEGVLGARADFEMLTPRERQIMALVVSGQRSKQIAAALAVTQATVKLHRGHIMHKMRARSIAELVRTAGLLELDLSAAGTRAAQGSTPALRSGVADRITGKRASRPTASAPALTGAAKG